MDQMVRKYTVRSGTRRWPVAVFYNLIDISALNAHVLFQACTGVKERRSDFLVKLARELAQSHMAAKEVHMWQMQKGDVVAVPDSKVAENGINIFPLWSFFFTAPAPATLGFIPLEDAPIRGD
ncbi:hypothetical protein MHYP_G00095080 [Metynnis hypsauchen]